MPATREDTTTARFVELLLEDGFQLRVANHGAGAGFVVEVSRSFPAGDVGHYIATESAASNLLGYAPMTYPGSVWGSFGDGVGGHAALMSGSGYFCKSGVSARWARKVAKLAGVQVEVRS